ncbi:hypothetical protein [Actinomyces sp. HMT897]|uniref:hypothetical protein n=1 Tax=Actinomyces sp. HMT897 TaxID=2789424 RepID=UPI00190948D7|nr:hypothetical protein [Actinomyces sp. HMT897]QQO78892.1 hypothetical protein JJJ15_06470 [Actinomyces sp. HMT897]
MRPATALTVSAAALALTLSGCSISVGSSPDRSSASPAVPAPAQTAPQAATSQAAPTPGTTSQSQTAPAQGAPAPAQGGGQASRQPDPAEASGVTNPDWQAIISGGSQTRPDASGNLSVDDAVSTVNVTGDVRALTISGAMSDVAAQKVEKLVVTASTVNVYVESVKEVEIQGADVNVYWVSGNPTVTGDGANHNVTQITR